MVLYIHVYSSYLFYFNHLKISYTFFISWFAQSELKWSHFSLNSVYAAQFSDNQTSLSPLVGLMNFTVGQTLFWKEHLYN